MEIDRIGNFLVDECGYLVRQCRPRNGKPYEHRCSLQTLELVAHTVDDLAGIPFTSVEMHALLEDRPWTQMHTALAFMKERGIIVPVRGRMHMANDDACHLEVMVEYHALREEPTQLRQD